MFSNQFKKFELLKKQHPERTLKIQARFTLFFGLTMAVLMTLFVVFPNILNVSPTLQFIVGITAVVLCLLAKVISIFVVNALSKNT